MGVSHSMPRVQGKCIFCEQEEPLLELKRVQSKDGHTIWTIFQCVTCDNIFARRFELRATAPLEPAKAEESETDQDEISVVDPPKKKLKRKQE